MRYVESMSAPGGGYGDDANPPPAGGRDDWTPPWDPPADYPPAYAPPGYSPPPPPPGYGPPPQYGAPPPYSDYGPPPGYAPPPYPGGYYPAPYAPVPAGTNGLAIASLIASFSGFLCCVVGSILAIVLGAVALNQIKETRQDGYGLAVTGIVIGVGTLVVFLIIAMFSLHSH